MKKSFVVLLSALLVTLCCSCTQTASTSQSGTGEEFSASVSSMDSISKEQSVSEADDGFKYEPFNDYMYRYPSSFERSSYVVGVEWDIFHGKLNSDYEVNLFIEQKELKIVDDDIELSFKDVITEAMKEKYNALLKKELSFVKYTENDVELLGKKFIKRTGIINTGFNEKAGVPQLCYTAYYGFVNFPSLSSEDRPMFIMSFSEGMDEQTKKDVEYVADTAFSSFRFLN